MNQPQIIIDPNEELRIVCRLLYYNIPGFCLNAKELQKKCQDEEDYKPKKLQELSDEIVEFMERKNESKRRFEEK